MCVGQYLLAIRVFFILFHGTYSAAGKDVKDAIIGICFDGNTYDAARMQTIADVTVAYINNQTLLPNNIRLDVIIKPIDNNQAILNGNEVCQMMTQGATSFVSVASCTATRYLASQTSAYSLPHLVLPGSECRLNAPRGVRVIRPAKDHLAAVLMAIVQSQRWGRLIVIYDDIHASITMDIIGIFTKNAIRVFLVKLPNNNVTASQARDVLEAVKVAVGNYKHIIVLCTDNNTKRIFRMASNYGLQRQDYQWLLASDNVQDSDLVAITAPNSAMTIVQGYHPPSASEFFYKNDNNADGNVTCTHFRNGIEASLFDAILSMAHVIQKTGGIVIDRSPKCDVVKSWLGLDRIEDAYREVNFVGVTGRITFDNTTRLWKPGQDVFLLKSARTSSDNRTEYEKVGTWNKKRGIEVSKNLFLNDITDFKNRTIIVAAKKNDPFIMNVTHNKDGSINFVGYCKDMIDELAKQLNFRYKAVIPPDDTYGAPLPDGTWSGIVGMVMRGEADLGLAPLTITKARSEVVDFTIVLQDGLGILTKRPTEQDRMLHIFKPFSTTVWLVLGTSLLAVGLALWMVNWLTPFSDFRRKEDGFCSDEISATENTWMIFSAFLSQSTHWYPGASSGRTLFNFATFFSIVVMAFYTSDLIAHLAVPSKPDYIRNVDELVRQREIRPIIKFGGSVYTLFKTSKLGNYKKVGDMMDGMPKTSSSPEVLRWVDKGGWAFIGDGTHLEYLANKWCDKYVIADETFHKFSFGYALSKGAPLNAAIDKQIRAMHQAGLITRWKAKWWEEKGECFIEREARKVKPLDLESVSGAFMVLGVATAAGFLLLLLELFVNVIRKQRSQQWTPNEGHGSETKASTNTLETICNDWPSPDGNAGIQPAYHKNNDGQPQISFKSKV